MGLVLFDPDEFRDLYPQYADFTDNQLLFAFDTACATVNNGENSPIPYDPPTDKSRQIVLYLLVCHLCELQARGPVVGSLAGASEGSVSVSFAVPKENRSQWFQQTQCGAGAWQILSHFTPGGRLYEGCFR